MRLANKLTITFSYFDITHGSKINNGNIIQNYTSD